METILISKNKLKIILDKTDILKYASGNEDASLTVENSIREILDTASNSVGFTFQSSECIAELFMSKDGGCEIYVTKAEENDMFFTEDNTICPNHINTPETVPYIFKFKNLENLLSFCKEVTRKKDLNADIYYDEEYDIFYVKTLSEILQAFEFGGILCHDAEKYYIEEHCRTVGNGSLKFLADFATS